MKNYYLQILRGGVLTLLLIISPSLFSQFSDNPVTTDNKNQVEMAIAVHPLNPKILMATWNDRIPPSNYTSIPGYAFSTDGGTTWPIIGTLEFEGADPSCVFDKSGNAYYCCINSSVNPREIWVYRKPNLGSSWYFYPVSPTGMPNVDKPYMAIDNTGGAFDQRLYVVWKSGGTVYLRHSDDEGVSWQPDSPVCVYYHTNKQELNPLTTHKQCPIPAIGPDGAVYVAYADYDTYDIKVAKLINGGDSIVTYSIVDPEFTEFEEGVGNYNIYPSFTSLAIDQCTGRSYIVLQKRDFYGKVKLYLSIGINGEGWCTPYEFLEFEEMHQFHPWITVDPTGKITIFFLYTYDGRFIEAYIVESYDKALSFRIPRLISSTSFDGTIGFLHEYQGITSTVGYSYPLWTDTRKGNADPYFARVPGDPTSANSFALASGASAKSVYTTFNSRWSAVFQSNGQLYYTFSTNTGSYWTGYEKISGNAELDALSNPSLNAYNNRYHSIFKSVTNGILYSRTNVSNGWEGPYTLTSIIPQYITSTVGGNGYGQVSFVESNPTLTLVNMYFLKHGTFNTADASPVLSNITTITTSTSALSSPSIAVDGNNIPHVVWIKNNDIYYSKKVGSSWTTPLNISNTINNSIAPSIAFSGDMIYAVWQEFVNNNWEIYYRIREANGIWSTTINLSNNSGQSIEPFVTNSNLSEPVVVWTDNTSGNYDIRYSLPITGMDGSFKATNEESHSPTITTRIIGNKLRLMASWTDRMGTPFLIEDDYKDLLPPLGKGANSWKSQNVTNQNSIEQTPLKIYPNPFNPNTKISYELNDDSYVIVEVFDVLGRKIKTLVDCKKEAGFYSVIFDASHLKSGIYFVRFIVRPQGNAIIDTRKILLTK